jgi:hypothetical protein
MEYQTSGGPAAVVGCLDGFLRSLQASSLRDGRSGDMDNTCCVSKKIVVLGGRAIGFHRLRDSIADFRA